MNRALLLLLPSLSPASEADIKTLLSREIITPRQVRLDVVEYVKGRIPVLKPVASAEEWKKESDRLRKNIFDNVLFRGEAAKWRDHKVQVKWLDTIEGGPGYRIKKLRYEALPGLWIPALLYEPENLSGKVGVMLAVNGHDRNGKAADYKQARCINLAKRGMMALNVEWLNMGQLNGAGYGHGRMNQLDLCGTPGLSVFYLAMSRGLDVLLSLENTDPTRIGISGLSGGGWQTIVLSSLDTRVTLSNPVAGYSSFLTRIEHYKDLGDSEQTPTDLATVADYTHLTAMLAPRPTLLTYNGKDNCCFESGYALPPLEKAARPMFKLFDRETSLRTHVNLDPGDHNFGKDNREALYRLIGAHWFRDSKDYDAREIDVTKEIKKAQELMVEMPKENADFNTLAHALMKTLPQLGTLPDKEVEARRWLEAARGRLSRVLRVGKPLNVFALKDAQEKKDGITVTYWKLCLGETEDRIVWTVPAVELTNEKNSGMTVLIGDVGRKALYGQAQRLLSDGQRVLLVDPFYNGESSIDQKAYLFALMVATVGDRSLGIQASQLQSIDTWLRSRYRETGVNLEAVGPKASITALAAAGLSKDHFASVKLHEPMGSLKEIVEKNVSFEQMPELFCYGLLEQFDMKQLAALVSPRPLRIVNARERAKSELGDLKKWYATFGRVADPFSDK